MFSSKIELDLSLATGRKFSFPNFVKAIKYSMNSGKFSPAIKVIAFFKEAMRSLCVEEPSEKKGVIDCVKVMELI